MNGAENGVSNGVKNGIHNRPEVLNRADEVSDVS